MAQRIALIPEELASSYQLQTPELRLEDSIESLLERANIADDQKVKLLSQMIMRYHKTVHELAEPIRVSMDDEIVEKDKVEDPPPMQDSILQGIM